MPIYEYFCNNCGYKLEIIQKINQVYQEACPKCQHAEMTKAISSPSFRLKGTGWYETDYKNSTNNQKTDNSSSEESAVS